MMKRIISVFLTFMIILSTALNAFAMTAGISTSKASIKEGESVVITLIFSESMENITNVEYSIYFNSDIFELTESEIGNASDLTQISGVITEGKGDFHSVTIVDTKSKGVKINAGTVCKLTFTAKTGIKESKTADFLLEKVNVRDNKFKQVSTVNIGTNSVKVSVKKVVFGDVNADEAVDGTDLLRLKKYLAGQGVSVDTELSDVNADGKISSVDLLRLSKYLAGYNVKLGK